MSDQPTPTPPWERKDDKKCPLEWVIYIARVNGYIDTSIKSWSELCTLHTRLAVLERVAWAAEKCTGNGFADYAECEELWAAIDAAKEQR